MQGDSLFEPFIVIIPDVIRGKENMFYQVDKGYETLSKQYSGFVHKCYDETSRHFIDFNMDILATSLPYQSMSDEIYSMRYATQKQILILYASYGMETTLWNKTDVITIPALNLCWKIFANTKIGLKEYKTTTINHGENVILTGYIKMDSLAKIKQAPPQRKSIIIAPHHTLDSAYNANLQLSNFFKYADFFLELYKKYPQIDFIFRPHPMLVIALADDKYWGKQKLNDYLSKLKTFSNVFYQEGGEYFDTFIHSSAIIHDCGSFISEYLYTDNPCLYMLKDSATNDNNLSTLGKECIKHYYHGFNEADIIDFIESVVILGNDTKKQERVKFAKEVVRVNYPNVADNILNAIKSELL